MRTNEARTYHRQSRADRDALATRLRASRQQSLEEGNRQSITTNVTPSHEPEAEEEASPKPLRAAFRPLSFEEWAVLIETAHGWPDGEVARLQAQGRAERSMIVVS